MGNKEFNDVQDFIEGFTSARDYDLIWGIEFLYKDKIYRITRDPTGDEEELKRMFGQEKTAYIKFFQIPPEIYPMAPNLPEAIFIGIYDDVQDLLNNGKIDNIALEDIIANEETEILAID